MSLSFRPPTISAASLRPVIAIAAHAQAHRALSLLFYPQSLHVLFSFLNPVNLVDLIIAPPSHVCWIWPHHLSTVMLTSPCKPDWCAITANASTLNGLNTRCLHNSLLACSRHLPCESSCAITALCPLTPCLPQLLIHSCLTPPPFPLLLNIPLLL